MSHHLISLVWFTVCYSHHFIICRGCSVRLQVVEIVSFFLAEILLSVNSFACNALPHPKEYALEGINLFAIETAMHIVPWAYLFRSVDVVVGYVHSACICNLSVDNHYLTVVTVENMVYVWEIERIKFVELYATSSLILHVLFLQRTIVACVSEGIIYGTNLYTLFRLLCKEVEECICYWVVSEVEVFEVHAMTRLTNSGEHILKFLCTCG